MRVLHLYSGNLYGGVETLLVTLARLRHLCPEMEPEFGLCFHGRLWDELTATGVPVHDHGPVRFSRPWSILRARWRLKVLLRQRKFDVAVVHMGWTHAVFGSVVWKAGVRLVHALHSVVDRRHWLNHWAARTKPDLIIANSRFIQGSADGWLPGVPLQTCHPVVERREFGDRAEVRRAVRRELGTPAEAVVILQASRLEDWKGQRVHLAALGELRDVPGWEAWFAGGPQMPGEERLLAELKETAARLGISDRVKFLGQRSDVLRLMMAADSYCQPNTGPEPFGIVFVEALYAGLPVVTSNFGGGAEIVNDSCGILTPPGDEAAVAGALRSLIIDPKRRTRLGADGLVWASTISDPKRQYAAFAECLRGSAAC